MDIRPLSVDTIIEQPYKVLRVLGEGGFGITYEAQNQLTKQRVAIKELIPQQLARRVYQEDNWEVLPLFGKEEELTYYQTCFLQEASIMQKLSQHDCIANVLDIIKAHSTIYIVMEFIDGITLKQYILENGALTCNELLPLIKPVIQALTELHKDGIIHRDISPDNIMLGIDNRLHLIDFGAADYENAHESRTLPVIIKPGYTPYEQYRRDGNIGAWTDIYSLCATMYLALTGVAPTDVTERIHRLKEGHDPLPSLAAHATISSWQAAGIEKGLSIEPSQRYQNMECFYQALILPPLERKRQLAAQKAHLLETNPTRIQSPKQRIRKMHSRKIFAAVLMVLIFLMLLTLPWNNRSKNEEKNPSDSFSSEQSATTRTPSDTNSSQSPAAEDQSTTKTATTRQTPTKEAWTEEIKTTEKTDTGNSSSAEPSDSTKSTAESRSHPADSTQAPKDAKTTKNENAYRVTPEEDMVPITLE